MVTASARCPAIRAVAMAPHRTRSRWWISKAENKIFAVAGVSPGKTAQATGINWDRLNTAGSGFSPAVRRKCVHNSKTLLWPGRRFCRSSNTNNTDATASHRSSYRRWAFSASSLITFFCFEEVTMIKFPQLFVTSTRFRLKVIAVRYGPSTLVDRDRRGGGSSVVVFLRSHWVCPRSSSFLLRTASASAFFASIRNADSLGGNVRPGLHVTRFVVGIFIPASSSGYS